MSFLINKFLKNNIVDILISSYFQVINILFFYIIIYIESKIFITDFNRIITYNTTLISVTFFAATNLFIRDIQKKIDIKLYYSHLFFGSTVITFLFLLVFFIFVEINNLLLFEITLFNYLSLYINLLVIEKRFELSSDKVKFSIRLLVHLIVFLISITCFYNQLISSHFFIVINIINNIITLLLNRIHEKILLSKSIKIITKNKKIVFYIIISSLLINLSGYLDKYIIEFKNHGFDNSYFITFRHATITNFLIFFPATIYWSKMKFKFCKEYFIKVNKFLSIVSILTFLAILISVVSYKIFFSLNIYNHNIFSYQLFNLIIFNFFYFSTFLITVFDFHYYINNNDRYFIQSSFIQVCILIIFSIIYFLYFDNSTYYSSILLLASISQLIFSKITFNKNKIVILKYILNA